MSRTTLALVAAVAAFGVAGPASAADYPPPSNPSGAKGKPKGPFKTRTVCAKGKGNAKNCFKTIQAAVNASKPGDTVIVPDGTFKENVKIVGAKKRYIKLIGNTETPAKVVLQGSGKKQNGVFINGADHVTVKGFEAKNYLANGFFVVNATGYTFRNLVATRTGTYGVYAFNSIGGSITNSTASENNDSGFYIGQTPPQTKPVRSIVRNVSSYGNVLGFSGTNMRYVTITKSLFFNNGLGIVPNTLDSEKYAPPEDNVITDNDVFWNNFNYFAGAPFPIRDGATGELAYPVGTGILLYGSRRTKVTKNRVFGNYLIGLAMVEAVTLEQADAKDLVGNEFSGNAFGTNGLSGTPGDDLNGIDIAYDGNGTGNCISGNTGVKTTIPADQSTFAACPFAGANTFNNDAFGQMIAPAGDDTHEKFWVKHPHQPIEGIEPLEHYTP
ncbi:MAG: nitrous oxide reductase family maturation protein NosD [Solirubrobacteraceae bacterium]